MCRLIGVRGEKSMLFDFQALRCPDATIKLNALLERFMSSGAPTITIRSIEPSLERSLKMRINHLSLPIQVYSKTFSITPDMKALWVQNHDEEDFVDVSLYRDFTLQRQ